MPSSRKLASRIVNLIDFSQARCVVEYGPGTGAITRELLRQRKNNPTLLVLIELDPVFCKTLRKRYGNEKDLIIVNDSAAHVKDILHSYGIDHADYIISGLPLASLPREVSRAILDATRNTLAENGSFILFQYTLLKRPLLTHYFSVANIIHVFWNVPPAYVITMKTPSQGDSSSSLLNP